MFGAIYVGLSGLTAYSRGLQQVSDNVTNLNSLGFKASNVSFSDLIGISGQGGLANSNGDVDSGNGVTIDEPRRDFQQGELRQTDRDLDLAVDGNGFLTLLKGDKVFYTRTGSFEVDKDGFIVLAGTDYRLATLDKSGAAVALSIDSSRTSTPTPTTTIKFADNLSSAANDGFGLSDIKVFDANGGQHVWQIRFDKKTDGGADEWNVKVTDDKGKTLGPQVLRFLQGNVDPATSKLVFDDTDNGLSVTMDFSSGVTSFSAGEVSTLRTTSVDGFAVGTVTSVTVNADGELELAYSNSQKKQLGPVAIADFRNPQALEQKSGGLFEETGTTERQLLASGDPRVGQVVSHRLEASNVDLAKQFGDLILIQRGFQASSQIISVSNDMIQQLFGIRGQN
jgi:flagellar hook protein FlgE